MNRSKIKLLSVLTLMIVGLFAVIGFANAAVEIRSVEWEGTDLGDGQTKVLGIEKGEEANIAIEFFSTEALDNVQVEAYLRGYEHGTIGDVTDVFDLKAGVTYVKHLTLKLKDNMEQDRYQLRIRVEGRNGAFAYNDYDLEVDTKRHSLVIYDVVVSPENGVKAGRALLTTVRIKNRGEKDENDVKVKVSVPALGISASDFIDEVEKEGEDTDDSITSEELYMRVPSCAEPGEYTMRVELVYNDGDDTTTASVPVSVIADETCGVSGDEEETPTTAAGKTIITIGPETQDVTVGAGGVVYPVTLTNSGSTAKTYTVSVTAPDWAEYRVSPSNVVVVPKGESKAVYVYFAAKENAPAGEAMFSVKVSSDDKTLKEVPLKAKVVAGEKTTGISLKRGLEIGLIILVVLLVILGLIIGFNKLRGNEDEEEPKEESYY